MAEYMMIFFSYATVAVVMLVMLLALVWIMFQVVKFSKIVMEIHYNASKRPYSHALPLANFFDARVLNDKERAMRVEALSILGKTIPIFIVLGGFIILAAIFTS